MHTDFTDWTDLRIKKNDLKIRNAPTILLHAYTLKRLTLKFSLRYQNFGTLKREILRGKYSRKHNLIMAGNPASFMLPL